MMKKHLLFILLSILFVACKKIDDPSPIGNTPLPSHHDPVYKTGDYFRNDTLEGVVFYTFGEHNGLMVSLEEAQLPWCTTSNINCLTGATNPYDGWNNTNIVMANYDMIHYPAIKWSYLRNTWHHVHYEHRMITHQQWYVPSSEELSKLLSNQASVNATLDSLGYPTLEDKTYWSSTELGTRSAATLRMQDSTVFVIESAKDCEFYVRAIRNF